MSLKIEIVMDIIVDPEQAMVVEIEKVVIRIVEVVVLGIRLVI